MKGRKVASLSGIAQPESFEQSLVKLGAELVYSKRFADHHRFTQQEVLNVINRGKKRQAEIILTTQKDAVRFPKIDRRDLPIYFMRVEIKIMSGAEDFQRLRAQDLFPLNGHFALLAGPLRGGVRAGAALTVVARLGRAGGGLAYWLDAPAPARGAQEPDGLLWQRKDRRRRSGRWRWRTSAGSAENYVSAVKTAAMSFEQLRTHLTFAGGEHVAPPAPGEKTRNVIMAIGHFGNFELYARVTRFLRGYRLATTYRGLRQPGLNRLMQSMRERTGCIYFDRRAEGSTLREYMSHPGSMLGLLIDQRSASGGLRLPFLGRECRGQRRAGCLRPALQRGSPSGHLLSDRSRRNGTSSGARKSRRASTGKSAHERGDHDRRQPRAGSGRAARPGQLVLGA